MITEDLLQTIESLQARITELERANLELQAEARTDHLTGLENRRGFDEALEEEWRRAMRNQTPLALLFVDLDHLKALNTKYGHLVANDLLGQVGKVLKGLTRRAGDRAFRFGGDELAVLLPDTDLDGALSVANKIKVLVETTVGCPAEGVSCTVSQGVAAIVPSYGETWSVLVESANQQMFAAKEAGRNCVMPKFYGIEEEQ